MGNNGSPGRLRTVLLRLRKGFNLLRYFRNYAGGASTVSHGPVELYFEVAQCCNISCIMCATHGAKWEALPLMPLDTARKGMPLFADALLLHTFGFGEPLMNRDLTGIIAMAREGGAAVDFFTNAMLLSEEKARELVDLGVDDLVVSFNGGTKETYEKVHERAKFEKVVENLRALDRIKRENRSSKPELAINFIAMNMNFNELPDVVELASGFGVKRIDVKALVVYENMPGMHPERRTYDPAVDDAVIKKSLALAKQRGIKLQLDNYLATGPAPAAAAGGKEGKPAAGTKGRLSRRETVCFQPWKTFYIKTDGTVKPCCFHAEEYSMGSVHRNTPEEIWNGREYRALRESIDGGVYPEGCRHCCEFNLRPRTDDSKNSYARLIGAKSSLEIYKIFTHGR